MGRPKIELTDRDWQDIEEMLEAGCSGKSVADKLGIHFDTLSDRIQERYSSDFSTFSRVKKERGADLLKLEAYRLAKSGVNTALLIFLLKSMCSLREDGSSAETETDAVVIIDETPTPEACLTCPNYRWHGQKQAS